MADEADLPYRAEYAKSGRSSCRGCKSSIGKETLRLAVMVQSPMFDGKQPHWYHVMCFFGKQRPKSVGDISHFESLRWEDQEKIRGKVESGAAAPPVAGKGKGKGKGKKRGASSGGFGDYTVEYAKSGRATCRGCEEKVLKGEVRISKKDFESEGAKMYGGQERWHHVDCFAKLRDELQFWESGELLPGFNTLSAEDKKMLKDKVPKTDVQVKQEDTTDGPTAPKQSKQDLEAVTKEEKLAKDQNKVMFGYRDKLKKQLAKKDMVQLLEENNQEVPTGEERILDRLSDAMTFGVLEPCTECKEGQLIYRSGLGYQCTGNLSEWTKCEHITQDPKRRPFKVPDSLKEYSFLDKYKYVPRKRVTRILPAATTTVKKQDETDGPKVFRPPPPLKNMQFVIVGETTKSKQELKEQIAKLGGKVVTKIHDKLAAIISNADEVEKMNNKMQEAKKWDIQVVTDDFLEEVKNGGADIIIAKKSICNWGSDVKSRIPVSQPVKSSSKSGSMFKKSMPSKVKLRLKGGLAVDPDTGLEDTAHVYQKGKDIFNAVLGVTDIQSRKNSFYKLQLLEADNGSGYWLFRAWGRIGTTIGSNKLERGTLINMKKLFEDLFEEKTGNVWSNRNNFVKVPGRMYPVDVDYSQGDDNDTEEVASRITSKLDKPVYDLVNMLFDINIMKKVMKEFELDMEKMPLGKLSKKQLQQAYSVLNDVQGLVNSGGSKGQFLDASNRFYTLIPHDFGLENPPILNTQEMIKQKLEMVESLMEMEIAYSLLKSSKPSASDEEVNPVDSHYAKLNTDIQVLDKKSEEFELLKKYVKNTHGVTHTSYDLEILEVFKVQRNNEEKRYKPFKKLSNRKLLWHGSRVTNFAGILSQGLRIAPPEAPVTGYMFGKGIYFADMVSKSANYCCTSPNNPTGIMLLCEVALGNMYERSQADYIEKLPKGKHSCKGLGRTEPDPAGSVVQPNGVEVPIGKGITTKRKDASLFYNEYIIYDVAQVNIQYLLKMDFKYKY